MIQSLKKKKKRRKTVTAPLQRGETGRKALLNKKGQPRATEEVSS